MQKEKVIYMHLEPSDIIIFINDVDLTFKLFINNFKDEKKIQYEVVSESIYDM